MGATALEGCNCIHPVPPPEGERRRGVDVAWAASIPFRTCRSGLVDATTTAFAFVFATEGAVQRSLEVVQ